MANYKPNDDGWSVFYNTPVQRLLYRCGLRLTGTKDSKDVWIIRRPISRETE